MNIFKRLKLRKPDKTWTYDEVKDAICDACKHKIPDVWERDTINHYCNGYVIKCEALKWRKQNQ